MPFHTPTFLLLCLATLALYYRGGERWQHGVLLLSSIAFYYYAGIVDTVLLLSVVGLNHLLVKAVARGGASGHRALVVAITSNLGVLAFFKYRGMAIGWLGWVTGSSLPSPSLVIPLGISFYIFQLVAYQVDVYRGLLAPEKSAWRTFLYIVFFPHHQAGPIMRPAKFLPQFYGVKEINWDEIGRGGMWILWGLTKKVAADRLALSVDEGFGVAPVHMLSVPEAWLLAIKYSAQIYGDFSGYSDIAVGLGLLFGYHLDRNFNQPYLSSNPSEFWQRWHITLSQWLRDYLYIPLGGNRGGELRTQVNLMVTMLLGGLWHGASLMFLFWGFLHGLLLLLHRMVPRLFSFVPLGWALTFAFTVIAWVPFRAPDWRTAATILGAMVGRVGIGSAIQWLWLVGFLAVFLTLHLGEHSVLASSDRRRVVTALWTRVPAFARGVAYAGVILGVVLGLVDKTTYIYFRF